MKRFCKKKNTFSSIATKFEAGIIFIWLVFCIISPYYRHAHLLECGFCEILSLAFLRRSALFKWIRKKYIILLYFREIKGK